MPETPALERRGRLLVLAETIHAAFLGLWLGALVMIGFGAPATFITLRGLDPSLPQYARFESPHYLIAGGHVVRRLFGICDTVQVIAAITVVLTFGVIAASRIVPRKHIILRAIFLAGLILLLTYRFFLLDPGLTETLDAYWAGAAAGDNPRALELRAQYDAGHRLESRLFAITAALVLGLLITAFASLWHRPAPRATAHA
jgi:hypothetical protein